MTWHTQNDSTPSTSSLGVEEAFSLTSYLDTIQSERAKSNPIPETSCSHDKQTESCPTSPSGTTWLPSMEIPGEEQLTFFAEDSPAKTSVRRVKEQELAESVRAYGKSMRDSLTKYGLALSLPKTHHFYALEDLLPSSKTLPKWGMMRGGVYWEQISSVDSTIENDFGCWLPTPTCSMKNGAARNRFLGSPTYRGSYPQEWIRTSHHCDAYLKPDYADGLIAFPHKWTDLKPLETRKFQQWRQAHSVFSQKD